MKDNNLTRAKEKSFLNIIEKKSSYISTEKIINVFTRDIYSNMFLFQLILIKPKLYLKQSINLGK